MKVYYKGNALASLSAKLSYAKGPGSQKLAEGIATAVKAGNTRDRLAGNTRYGTTVNRLRATRKGEYKGLTGPPLAPRGAASRVISAFKSVARRRGGKWEIVAGWEDGGLGPAHILAFLNRDRPIFGVSPQTWVEIRKLILQFKLGLLKSR